MVSRLVFGMYSYTSSFSSSSRQKPTSLTRLLCWSFATNTSSVFSSWMPCLEPSESLFTAISWPSESTPCGGCELITYTLTKTWTNMASFKIFFVPYKPHQNLLRQAYCFQQSYLLLSVVLIGQEEENHRCFQYHLDLWNLLEENRYTVIQPMKDMVLWKS